MRPQDRVAALTAIKHGIDEQIKVDKEATLALADQVGAKVFTTPYGQVTVVRKEAGTTVEIDEAALLEWAVANRPDDCEIVTVLKPWLRGELTANLIPVGDVVLDKNTGEVCPFASVRAFSAGEPYVSYPNTTESKAWKQRALELVADQADVLSEGLRSIDGAA